MPVKRGGGSLAETREGLARLEERLANLMERMIEQLGAIEHQLQSMSETLADHRSRLEELEHGSAARSRAWREVLTYAMALGALIFSGMRALR